MKLTTLLISLSLALQLAASTNRPDVHANAAASASSTSAAAPESDSKSGASVAVERDAKKQSAQDDQPTISSWDTMLESLNELIMSDAHAQPANPSMPVRAYHTDNDAKIWAEVLNADGEHFDHDMKAIDDAVTTHNFASAYIIGNSIRKQRTPAATDKYLAIVNRLFACAPCENDIIIRRFMLEAIRCDFNMGPISRDITHHGAAFLFRPALTSAQGQHPYHLARALRQETRVLSVVDGFRLEDEHKLIVFRALWQRSLFERYLICTVLDLYKKAKSVDFVGATSLETRALNNIKQASDNVHEGLLNNFALPFCMRNNPHLTAMLVAGMAPTHMPPELVPIITNYAAEYRLGVDCGKASCFRFGASRNGPMRMVLSYQHACIDSLAGLGEKEYGTPIGQVDLQGNLLEILPLGMCANLGDVTDLNFATNVLRTIEVGAFAGAHNLEVLNLSQNFVAEIPDEIYSLPKLKKLYLEGNPLSEDAKKKYQAWKERRNKLEEGVAISAVVDANANAMAAQAKSS